MMRPSQWLITISILLFAVTLLPVSLGLFADEGGTVRYTENVFGDEVALYGKGLYERETTFKAPINKGTDAVILFGVLPLLATSLFGYARGGRRWQLVHAGTITCLLYYSALMAFEAVFNGMYPAYIAMFSLSFYGLILSLRQIQAEELFETKGTQLPRRGLVIFLLLTGASVFVWLLEIIGAMQADKLPPHYGVSVTLPTYALDIAIIAPAAFITAYRVSRREAWGYVWAVILLVLNALIGLIVLSQTLFQYAHGIILDLGEFIPFVSVFVVLSGIAAFLVFRILQNVVHWQN